MNLIKVVHFRAVIEHYRVPILRRLSKIPGIDFTVYAGDNRKSFHEQQVATARDVGKTEGIQWKKIKSFWTRWPVLMFWQPGAIKAALKEPMDAAIFSLPFRSLSGILVRLICYIRGIPVVEWEQIVTHRKRGLKIQCKMLWYRKAHAILPYGKFARNYLLKQGFQKNRIFVVGNSLDYEVQIAVRKALTEKDQKACRESFGASNPNDRLVFFSGRLNKQKRIDLLIKALARLKKGGRRVFLVLIGEGRESENLKSLSREMGLEDHVTFLGANYDESRVGKIIFSCDLCVVPHAVGLIAVHSLVYGVPVLTSEVFRGDHGLEIEAVVEGITGSFFQDNDLDDLLNKMEAMLYPIPSRIRMSENCQNMIDKAYTPARQERIFIKALNSCLPLNKQIEMPKRYP